MDLGETEFGGVDWTDLAQDRECGNEPLGSIKCSETIEWFHNWSTQPREYN
jgi:hypothetical protein